MEEIQKKINGYDNYSVSNMGNVRNDKTGRVLKGSKDTNGYIYVVLKNKNLSIHHLVADYFLEDKRNVMIKVVDHINNIKTDNRVENLQIITQRENTIKEIKNKENKTSKYIGVNYCKTYKKYKARIYINGKRHHLGYFKTEEEASEAYQNKLKEINEKREV